MNELPLSVFEILLAVDIIVVAYVLWSIDFNKPTSINKIFSSVISSFLSYILSTYIIDGKVVQTYADSTGYHFIPYQSIPIHYFLLGFAVLMTVVTLFLIVKIISDYFEKLETKSALGDWKQNSFTKER